MKNSKIFLYILIAIIPLFICFNVFYSDSFCLESTLTTTLWNSYNIASEYFVARSGQKLVGGDYVSTDISGVSGISGGLMNEDYGNINAGVYGKTPIDVNSLMALAKDVDTSKYTLEELNALSYQMANLPWTTNGSIAFKNIAFGGVNLYFAVNKAGEWLGNSYDNILANFQTQNVELDTNVKTYSVQNYEYDGLLYTQFLLTTKAPNYKYIDVNFGVRSYIYSVKDEYSDDYFVHIVIPASDSNTFLNYSNAKYLQNGYDTPSTRVLSFRSRDNFVINNIEYVDYWVYVTGISQNLVVGYPISSLNDIKAKITLDGYVGESVNSELVDTKGLPYLADDLGEFATTIGDLYPVIEELRDSILDIPVSDELTSIISDVIEGQIADLIDDIKEKSLHLNIDDVIEDTGTDTLVNEGITIPEGFDNGIISNTLEVFELPFNFVSIFTPLFYLFGNFAGFFAIWSFVPIIFIAVLIIWALK